MTPEQIIEIAQRRGNDAALQVARQCQDPDLIKLMQNRINPPKPRSKKTSVPQILLEGSGMHLANLGFMQVDSFR